MQLEFIKRKASLEIMTKYNKKVEITIIELEDDTNKRYKVTKRLPDMRVAETKIFETKEEARKQFDEWLD